MTINAKTIFGALALSVVSGLIVTYLWQKFSSPARTCAGQASWNQNVVSQGALLNANKTGANPASTYGGGAPVTNFRAWRRVGQVQVLAQ